MTIAIGLHGEVETVDLHSITVDVKTGKVSTIYRVTEGTEVTYRTIAVPGISATTFIATVVAAAKTEIGIKVTKTAAEPIEEPIP
jgi:hypothetical protein